MFQQWFNKNMIFICQISHPNTLMYLNIILNMNILITIIIYIFTTQHMSQTKMRVEVIAIHTFHNSLMSSSSDHRV